MASSGTSTNDINLFDAHPGEGVEIAPLGDEPGAWAVAATLSRLIACVEPWLATTLRRPERRRAARPAPRLAGRGRSRRHGGRARLAAPVVVAAVALVVLKSGGSAEQRTEPSRTEPSPTATDWLSRASARVAKVGGGPDRQPATAHRAPRRPAAKPAPRRWRADHQRRHVALSRRSRVAGLQQTAPRPSRAFTPATTALPTPAARAPGGGRQQGRRSSAPARADAVAAEFGIEK